MEALIGWLLRGEQMAALAREELALAAAAVARTTRAERLPELGRLRRSNS